MARVTPWVDAAAITVTPKIASKERTKLAPGPDGPSAALVKAVGLHEAAQRGVCRHGLQVGPRCRKGDKIVVMQLDAQPL